MISAFTCSLLIGLGAHTQQLDRPEINLENPLFIAQPECNSGKYRIAVRHTSGITRVEDGAGLNEFIFMIRIK